MIRQSSAIFASLLAVCALLVAVLATLSPARAGAVPAKGATSIEVRLRGATGTETAALRVGDVELFAGQISTEWMLIDAPLSSMATGAIELVFTNDGDTKTGDRSLEVDYLSIDDQPISADSPFVYSEGAFAPPNGCSPGFVQSSVLGCGGKFVFGVLDDSGVLSRPLDPHGNQRGLPLLSDGEVDIVARGHFGGERFEVRVGDIIIGEAATTRFWRTYRFEVDPALVGDLSVTFTSDFWAASPDGSTTFDANLDVDYVAFDGVELQAEDAWSDGTYVDGEGCVPGYQKSQTLHCNGMFVFDHVPAHG